MTDDALYRAILADPADDTLRLAYADWLDENPAPCRRCLGTGSHASSGDRLAERYGTHGAARIAAASTCGACGGTGTGGNARWAEFIRVQVELARDPGATLNPDATYGEYADLRRRERELFDSHALDWFPMPTHPFPVTLRWHKSVVHQQPWGFVERGFVSEVRLTAAAFLGGPCEFCRGRGHFQTPNSYAECPRCLGTHGVGTGSIEGLAKALFERHPLEQVVLSDKRPATHQWSGGENWLPVAVIATMAELYPANLWAGRRMVFNTVDEAAAALSAALVAHGRAAAGLPPLPVMGG